MREESLAWASGKSRGLSGAWGSSRRNEVLDADGIAAEILFVDGLTEGNSPPFGGDLGLMPLGVVPELQWAGCRANKRWMAEFVAMAPKRRLGLPHMFTGQARYHDPKYDPLWAICEERGMVIHFHSGAAPMHEYFGVDLFAQNQEEPTEPLVEMPGSLGIYVTAVAWWLTRPLVYMIWGGVFGRFPALKIAVTEGSTIWVPELLQLMDQRFGDPHFSAKIGTDYKSHLSIYKVSVGRSLSAGHRRLDHRARMFPSPFTACGASLRSTYHPPFIAFEILT
jgi:hypothetical protein